MKTILSFQFHPLVNFIFPISYNGFLTNSLSLDVVNLSHLIDLKDTLLFTGVSAAVSNSKVSF